ncbi:hypothetical protein EW145_g4691 [Phellinidium pouzarii]|uniref:Peptidase S9 prolyl oligopeptidase catalytic domain-containing protein n=1 Tax=Phellinidium pouzarii TaxID=167371 RepID=A0A4S4L2J8_9AGAM|nr:hypothetical protein EW145_g4691 [Phellinidium pouzarii]
MELDAESYFLQWKLSLSEDWDVLGPFPIHAREQHFLNPGFPLDLTVPYKHEANKTWPSSYADSAEVTWTKFQSGNQGNLSVSFPDIRWSYLRATDGWAALQHHSILHTTLTVTPLQITPKPPPLPPLRILVELKQGTFFSILPKEALESFSPEWHVGNVYDLLGAAPNSVELPGTLSVNKSTTFDFFVSGDYEIRLFGDPRDNSEEDPTLKLNVSVSLDERRNAVVRQDFRDVVCDFVDGYAFGDVLGVGLRSLDGWWTVEGIQVPVNSTKELGLSIHSRQTIAPSQIRVIPISIKQNKPFTGNTISFSLDLVEHLPGSDIPRSRANIPVTLIPRFIPLWNASKCDAIRAVFFFAMSHPTIFLAKPPRFSSLDSSSIPILALHGAGVEIVTSPFWADAIHRQKHSWVIMPVGRTEWGLDWHGGSASEAWASVEALSSILHTHWEAWTFQHNTEVVLLGHSNGGQGVWHLTAHYPDRVRAALPAAGYLNAQAYVPLTLARGWRFADPALRMVLESSLTHDNNELFLTADKVPVLAIHGGDDTNVPPWHSREYVSVARSWGTSANISFHEDEGQPHWYPEVFQGAHVENFLDAMLDPDLKRDPQPVHFTLTVIDPAHSGSLHGWKIDALLIPGSDDAIRVRTTNVREFSFSTFAGGLNSRELLVNGEQLSITRSDDSSQAFSMSDDGIWTHKILISSVLSRPPGRIQNILDTSGPLTIVIPSDLLAFPKALSAALRFVHALDVYLKLDAEIILDTFALRQGAWPVEMKGSLIIIGGAENTFARSLLQVTPQRRLTEFGIGENGEWLFRDQPLSRFESLGIMFTHPHPMSAESAAVFLAGTDTSGLERALRLFPLRTGIAVPDWVIIGLTADRLGAGGVVGAGVWNSSWKWSEAMSWMM